MASKESKDTRSNLHRVGGGAGGARKRPKQQNLAPIKLYSVVAFLEKGKESRMVVPHHWVDKDINVLSFPKKDISIHVMKWAKPAPDWKEYEITKLLLELGTKARCDEFEKNYVDSTQTDSEVDSDATVVDTPSSQRVRTPILRSPADMGLRRRIISSPEAEVQSPPKRKKSSSSWNGRVLSMEQTPIPSTDATNVIPASQ